MDLTLGNLDEIKKAVLPDALRTVTDTQFDFILAVIAKGVAAEFEKQTCRRLSRVVGEVEEFSADKMCYTLSRYPLEALTQIELRSSIASGWGVIDINSIYNARMRSGLLEFAYLMGVYSDALRVTYTGGYFHEILEPTDGGYPTAQPGGSFSVPDDLKSAWFTQTRFEFERTDKLGKGFLADGSTPVADVVLLPAVMATLAAHRRFPN